MAAELVLTFGASQDLDETYPWYESQRPGLGEAFLVSVDDRLRAICRMPESYAIEYESYRRAFIGRFPYAIFYEYFSQVVTVFAVYHVARDPQKWRERLK